MTFADQLREACAGRQQRELAEFLGVPRKTVENWLQQRNTPPEYVRRAVLEKLRTLPGVKR